MADNDPVLVDGQPIKRFTVVRTKADGEVIEHLESYDSFDEVQGRRWRNDWSYRIRAGGRYLTRKEFEDQFGPKS